MTERLEIRQLPDQAYGIWDNAKNDWARNSGVAYSRHRRKDAEVLLEIMTQSIQGVSDLRAMFPEDTGKEG